MRRLLAAVLAPLVGATTACVGFVITLLYNQPAASSRLPALFGHWLGFYLLFGLPVAYTAEAIAIALYRRRAPTPDPHLWVPTIIAAPLGGFLVFAVWGAMFGPSFGLATLPSGLFGGAAAGITYWAASPRHSRAPAAA
jgi:hypothetical protein